jgi:hypothetical protein
VSTNEKDAESVWSSGAGATMWPSIVGNANLCANLELGSFQQHHVPVNSRNSRCAGLTRLGSDRRVPTVLQILNWLLQVQFRGGQMDEKRAPLPGELSTSIYPPNFLTMP